MSQLDNSINIFFEGRIDKNNSSMSSLEKGIIPGANKREMNEAQKGKNTIKKDAHRQKDDKSCCNTDGCLVF